MREQMIFLYVWCEKYRLSNHYKNRDPGGKFSWFQARMSYREYIRDFVPAFHEPLIHTRCRGKHRCC